MDKRTRPEGDSPQRQFRTGEKKKEEDPIYFATRVRELCENKLRRVYMYMFILARNSDTVLIQRR